MTEIAVITGASSGIGESLAYELSNCNYKLVLVARSKNKIDIIKKKIQSNGRECLALALDLSDPNSIKKLKKETESFGNVSIIVNNAGLGQFNKLEDITLEEWDRHSNVNLRASFLVSQAFIGNMKSCNKGTIVFINSVAGKKGYPNSAAYSASKYGMRGLADSLREELRSDNIKIISIFPGAVNTSFWDKIDTSFSKSEMLDVNVLSKSIVSVIVSPGNFTVEELVVRRTEGDF